MPGNNNNNTSFCFSMSLSPIMLVREFIVRRVYKHNLVHYVTMEHPDQVTTHMIAIVSCISRTPKLKICILDSNGIRHQCSCYVVGTVFANEDDFSFFVIITRVSRSILMLKNWHANGWLMTTTMTMFITTLSRIMVAKEQNCCSVSSLVICVCSNRRRVGHSKQRKKEKGFVSSLLAKTVCLADIVCSIRANCWRRRRWW